MIEIDAGRVLPQAQGSSLSFHISKTTQGNSVFSNIIMKETNNRYDTQILFKYNGQNLKDSEIEWKHESSSQ